MYILQIIPNNYQNQVTKMFPEQKYIYRNRRETKENKKLFTAMINNNLITKEKS